MHYTTRQSSGVEALGESPTFMAFQEQLSRVAKVDRPVLILGERGSGKELAIRRLHYLSARWQGPLVALNCAALSPGVLESELFGHEAGAFTGASGRRKGRFEAAESGSLFLDEIGLVPINVQEKILRVVEYREFERVGGSEPIEVDVRIVGATHADLPALAETGQFKRDLLDRLSFEVLFLPPLRERREDILLLARHFANRMATELGRPGLVEFSPNAESQLESYPWPGNIRELKNVIERAVYRSTGTRIGSIEFNPFVCPWTPQAETTATPTTESSQQTAPVIAPTKRLSLQEAIAQLEVQHIREALEKNGFHQGKAAESLGLSYHQFRRLMAKHKKAL
ncbi:MAG: phage shock protein operon transcriptional activator [Opitutales bacterium]|nr:phage shock protein operon transcriptional activator [Opitutales bacterium]